MSAPIISSTFALVVLVLVAPLFALLYVDTHPLTPSSAAAVNGHLHVVQLAVQALLVIVISVIPQLVSMSMRVAVINIAAVVWLAVAILRMPYYHHIM